MGVIYNNWKLHGIGSYMIRATSDGGSRRDWGNVQLRVLSLGRPSLGPSQHTTETHQSLQLK